ncbi:MAG: NADH-quinone oxidoreductase subunit NuoN [Gammaproteobacteria bacterium]|jgi:NADH-quinone oxidoreductase subunit N|nr:NADH-quinone oxidoreductase subunit NuoN [Gammaproteobacteria bacterium]MBU0770211.1 NADH-quinone oxidoreductase subunit NuoN [Gammaproteobacteria bacterium]MBU0857280.1 NADH-quinone oxidoreductase subunit NuoN [Gammaproteobacteria bacterium]MBU1846245.1 NADH-quinone oxidoreductase subunit NuoN [Gammaproteobacteria bacterium]
MNFPLPNLFPASAEIFVLVMACVVLLADLYKSERQSWLPYMLTLTTLAGAFAIQAGTAGPDTTLTFSGMFVDDRLADVLKCCLYLTVFAVVIYSRGYLLARAMERGEYYLLVLFATLGMQVMISSNHFLTLYLGLEMLSLAIYALVALDRESARATEAAMKYFVLGALASGLLLYGMSMIYGATGTLEISAIARKLSDPTTNMEVLRFGLVFLVAGLAFKIGVVPFHMWIPDVYHGASTPITLLIGSAPKLAGFAMAIRLLVDGLPALASEWQQMLMLLAVLSIALGNIVAIAQTNMKRMLAYSTISHMGFMLLGLVSGVIELHASGDIHLSYAFGSAMFYTIAYVLMSAAAFGTLLLMSRAGVEADELEDLKGLNRRSPWFAAVLMMVMFSMAGIPFFVGFFAKLAVLQAVVAAGYLYTAVFAVMMSLVGAFFYLRVVKLMYFDAPLDETPITASGEMRALLSVNGLAIALLGLMPQPLLALCASALGQTLN